MDTTDSNRCCFLFTDIEDSTRLWEQYNAAMPVAYERHDAILRDCVARHGGIVFKVIGDAFQAAFETELAGLLATQEAQRALTALPWHEVGLPENLRVRMALHVVSIAPDTEGDFRSPELNRLGRLLGASHGGQILLSQGASQAAAPILPSGWTLLDCGPHRLKGLTHPERIYQLMAPGLVHTFPPLQSFDNRPNNLPAQPTELIGRESELKSIQEQLHAGIRMLSLLGPGGIGKTHLAIEAGIQLLEDIVERAWFVPLEAVTLPILVPAAIARALSIPDDSAQSLEERLQAYFQDGHQLLILDNCEHLIDTAADLAARLLATCPRLRILATSRTRLRIRAEQIFPVEPLAIPQKSATTSLDQLAQIGAMHLFIDRARTAQQDFALTDANAATVVRICQRLEGIPLAIELAAARLHTLSLIELHDGLDHRLHVLHEGARDLPERQQTLRHMISWSYDLLPASCQTLFLDLGVFSSGFTPQSAIVVTSETKRTVTSVAKDLEMLQEANLLRSSPASVNRFVMLETIREFSLERLAERGDESRLRERHARFVADLIGRANEVREQDDDIAFATVLEPEHENVQAALEWLVINEPEVALRLATSLVAFWQVGGHLTEGRAILERATAAANLESPELRARAAQAIGGMALEQGDFAKAGEQFAQAAAIWKDLGNTLMLAEAERGCGSAAFGRGEFALAEHLFTEALHGYQLIDDVQGIGASFNQLGLIAQAKGDLTSALSLHNESLAIKRARGDQIGIATSLNNLGLVLLAQNEPLRAKDVLNEALALSQEIGDQIGIAMLFNALGDVAVAEEDISTAMSLYRDDLAVCEEIGDKFGIARAYASLGHCALLSRDFATALAGLHTSIDLYRRFDANAELIVCLERVAAIWIETGQHEDAARLLATTTQARETTGLTQMPVEAATLASMLARLEESLGQDAFATVFSPAQSRSLPDLVEEVLAKTKADASTPGYPAV